MRVLVLLLLLPSSLHAGAWPRGAGETFAALGLEGNSGGFTATFLVERGWSDRLTFGVDGFIDEANESLTAYAFARYTFPTEGPGVWAVTGGFGGEYRVDQREQILTEGGPIEIVDHPRAGAFVRLGAHYGRGLENGWLAADFSFDFGNLTSQVDPPLPNEDIQRAKLDLTYGRRLTDDLTVISQLFLEDYDGAAGQSVQFGLAYDVNVATVEAALRQGVGPSSETTLKLGLWRSF